MPRADYAHQMTDKQLAELESRISKLYKQAADELSDTVTAYFKQFEKRDAEMQDKLKVGTITEQEYKQWRLAQIGRGRRYEALRDKVAERYHDANKVALAYANDATPGIYTLNRNYAAYTIEQVSSSADFTLWDEQTVRRLIQNPEEYLLYYPPDRKLNNAKDIAYEKKQISASVTSGILQGKSVYKIADDLQDRMQGMNRKMAVRTARTVVTGAQNAGRMESYAAAEKMGIKLKRRWLATLDNRTRHAHALLDGQTAEIDKPFEVEGYKIMFPGDASAPAFLVENCRCTLAAEVDGEDTSSGGRRAIDPETGESVLVEDMTYAEWAGWKEKQPQKPVFVKANTLEEAEAYAKEKIFSGAYLAKVSYKGVDVDIANGINETLEAVTKKYGRKLSGIEVVNPKTSKGIKMLGGSADAPFSTNPLSGVVYVNKDILKNGKALQAYNKKGQDSFDFVIKNKDKLTGNTRKLAETYEKAGKDLVDSSLEGMITHEYGHFLAVSINPKSDLVSRITDGMESHLISGYSQHNVREYLAESFVEYERGDRSKLDPIVVELFEEALKK